MWLDQHLQAAGGRPGHAAHPRLRRRRARRPERARRARPRRLRLSMGALCSLGTGIGKARHVAGAVRRELDNLRPLRGRSPPLATSLPSARQWSWCPSRGTPCFKLAHKMGLPEFPKQFLASGRIGFYLRVAREGVIRAGDPVVPVKLAPDSFTVRGLSSPAILRTKKRRGLSPRRAAPGALRWLAQGLRGNGSERRRLVMRLRVSIEKVVHSATITGLNSRKVTSANPVVVV